MRLNKMGKKILNNAHHLCTTEVYWKWAFNIIALTFKGFHISRVQIYPSSQHMFQNVSKKITSRDNLWDIRSILKQFLVASFKATWTPVLNSSKEERRNKVAALVESPSSDLFVQRTTDSAPVLLEKGSYNTQ